MMALGPEDVSKLRIGKLTKPTYVAAPPRVAMRPAYMANARVQPSLCAPLP